MTTASPDLDHLRRSFVHLAAMCEDEEDARHGGASPLYATLGRHVGANDDLLALAGGGAKRQPPPNLLFGAVHEMVLAGADHPLARHYPSVGGDRPATDAGPAFTDFCATHRETIAARIATGRVQTNVVGRCGALRAGVALAWARTGRRPVHLVEVGASAGLNLRMDAYRCVYDDGRAAGPAESPVRLSTAVRGMAPADLPDDGPEIVGRIGIDLEPVDVHDRQATRWVEALIWPDHADRLEQFRAAVTLARAGDPPDLRAGDGIDLLPDAIAQSPPDALPCVFHSHAIYQMPTTWRDRLAATLDAIGRERDLARVALEWLEEDAVPQLRLTTWREGTRTDTHLAEVHHHGRWVRWRG